MRRVLLAGAISLLISVGVAFADTKTDYDHSVNFNKFRTFAWKIDKASDDVVENEMVLSRIQDAASMQLNVRGMKEDNRSPDVYLVPHVSARDVQNIDYLPGPGWSTWGGYGWGGYGWGYGWPYDTVVYNYVEGTIILDMVDARTDQLVWRSISTKSGDDLIDVQKEKKVDKMMHDAFKHFPRWAAIER
jgi:hypothetical protein